MRSMPIILGAAFALTSGVAVAKNAPTLSDHAIQILDHVHHVNGLEMALGKMAIDKGSPDVKAYAQHLVADHKKADAELTALANKEDVAISEEEPTTPEAVVMAKIELGTKIELDTLSGIDFDHAYLAAMVDGHRRELAKIDADLAMGVDPSVKAMLQEIRPVIAMHADEAKRLMLPTK